MSYKAGRAGWNIVPKIWQRFMSGDISGSVRYKPVCPAGLTAMLGQVAQALICLGAWYLQGQRSHHLSAPCPRAALLSRKVFSSHPNPLCPFCRTFCPVTGHLWEESGFTFPLMPYRQWETVAGTLLSCLLSMLSKIRFAAWIEPRTSL